MLPKVMPEAVSSEPEKLFGQPLPYGFNNSNIPQHPLPEGQDNLLARSQAPPYPQNLASHLQPPPLGWSVDSAKTGAGSQPNLDAGSQPNLDAASTIVEVPGLEGNGDDDKSNPFSEKKIRMAFIRKVYAILTLQLLITGGTIAAFLSNEKLIKFVANYPEIILASMLSSIVIMVVLSCSKTCRRQWPMNLIILIIFTLCQALMLGTICCFFKVDQVLIAALICAVVCLGLTIFAFQTKLDFTICGSSLFVLLLILLVASSILMFFPGRIVSVVYSSLGVLVFSLYLIYDTQMMLGGKHKLSISPEEYIFAVLTIYLDVIQLFLHIIHLLGFETD